MSSTRRLRAEMNAAAAAKIGLQRAETHSSNGMIEAVSITTAHVSRGA